MKNVINKTMIKRLLSFIIVMSIFLNLFSIITSAYGGSLNFGGLNSISVYIRNVGNGKYIAEPSGNLFNGKGLVLREGEETLSQRWIVYSCGNGYYSFHSAWDENYVLAVAGGEDVVGARFVLMYVSNVLNVPDNARFKLRNYEFNGITYLQPKVSVNNSTINVISYNESEDKLTNETARDLYDSASHQLWAFESVERSIQLNNWDLVDIGGHCDWECSSKYSAMIVKATDAWNNYIGDEVFRPDAWNLVQDVKLKDADTDPTGKGYLACTFPKSLTHGTNASSICFYEDAMSSLESDLQRQKTVMHELGHALGLDENRESTSSDRLGNVMQQGSLPYSTFISLDDKASVEEARLGF
ncbi:MAG: RICIN domain-containing protein [Clostridia bacterium]|nr:RICIN domain-containing protein [Clostridia bacterium]